MSLPATTSPSVNGDTPSTSSPRTGASCLTNGNSDGLLTPAASNITSNDVAPSWKPIYELGSPPDVKRPYRPEEALEDLPGVSYALEVFLSSHMLESEEYCHKMDEPKERLYFATGYGLIQCVKALMSYEDEDLLAGINHTRHGNHIANQHRKKQAFLGSRLAGYVVSHLSSSASHIRSMTPVERHAELTYAESLFEKALLGIVYSGDWLAFIKEALNMRTTIGIYRQLGQFLDAVDKEASERGEGPIDKTIDPHFRSGVHLGIGISHIILSLMPGRLLTLVELFGYHGDRKVGLEALMKAGGWSREKEEPEICAKEEGVRRSLCDMTLLIFHLILSSFTFDGIDITIADKILNWNLKRYPNGVFFLFGAGRLALCQSQPSKAVQYYTKAMESQQQYRNLHHISFWEMAIANLALWDIPASLKCWETLRTEATWSKAMYTYGMSVCLLEVGGDTEKKEAAKLLKKVPELRQRIAGKSIPLEKFVARKARKFSQQGNRLALPALELAYIFLGIAHAPRNVIIGSMLPEIEKVLTKVDAHKSNSKNYEGGQGYWDDYCLAQFLKGVCLRYVAYPDPDAIIDPYETISLPKLQAETGSEEAFRLVLKNGPKIELDHHLVYHAHYELGRLLACQNNHDAARNEFELVQSGKHLEVGPSGKKGKYSMENALHMRCYAALEALHQKRL